MPNKRIGRYEILDTLGQGAMGVVHLARDSIIDRQVALKTLRLDVDSDTADEFHERFFREAQAAGRLNHRGIVTVHDIGEDAETGLVYIAMEYVEGRDLKEILSSKKRMRPSQAAQIVAEVALALEYAHSMGVIHRDIKPANIILTTDGAPKVMDFGVARLDSSNLTVEGQFIGTPNFMAPEQILGRPVDGRSDLFSLGVVLFNLLTGKRPFPGANMHEVTLKITQAPCPIPSTVVEGLPAAFNPIVLKCLEKDPDKRFQSGAELARVLAAIARSLAHLEGEKDARTGTFQPALETRIAATKRPEPQALATPARRRRPRELWRSLPLPDFLSWPVNGGWFATILAICSVCVLLPLVVLGLRIDRGPWPAPADSATRARHIAVREFRRAERAFAGGDLLAAEASCLLALHHAPASPGGRSLMARIRTGLLTEESILEQRGKIESTVTEGRRLYKEGRYSSAAEKFEEALSLEPNNEIAGSYLELSRERMRVAAKPPPVQTTSKQGTKPSRAIRVPTAPAPTPGLARITLNFNSPINSGVFVVTIDGEVLTEVPFDFTRKALLGIKRKGTGTVKKALIAPSGKRTIGIRLTSADLATAAAAEFTENLAPGSQWSLRVDQPTATGKPSFFLVRSDR